MSRSFSTPGLYNGHDLTGGRSWGRRGALCGTLALSFGRRTIFLELSVARAETSGGQPYRLGQLTSSRGRAVDDTLARARQAKKMQVDTHASNPSLEVRSSMDGSPRHEDDPFRHVKFWDCLSPVEKDEFRAIAIVRAFARGARLMQEGESADHVMVILEGRTEIRARNDDGGERVIAQRGPGQLIGERAALQVSVRSATVVALETVQALVVSTEGFAAFVSAHPAVLEIVESQVYERLTEGLGDQRDRALQGHQEGSPGRVSTERQPEGLPRQLRGLTGENCTVVVTDVAGFGGRDRTSNDRRIIREAILDMTRLSLDGIWEACSCEDRGDGLLIIVPPTVPTGEVLDHLRTMLPVTLRKHNRTYAASVQIALRVAVEVGPVVSDAMGVASDAIIRAVRMRDAPVLKTAMVREGAVLGIILSEFVYETAVRQGSDFVDPACYRRVVVDVKETAALPAWMELVVPPRLSPLEPLVVAA